MVREYLTKRLRLSTPVGNEAERAMWERWGRTYQEERTASVKALRQECARSDEEQVGSQGGRSTVSEGESRRR